MFDDDPQCDEEDENCQEAEFCMNLQKFEDKATIEDITSELTYAAVKQHDDSCENDIPWEHEEKG